MNSTLNEAIKEYRNGNIEKSYKVAMKDDGINKNTTAEQWKEFAGKAVARRETEEKLHEEILNG